MTIVQHTWVTTESSSFEEENDLQDRLCIVSFHVSAYLCISISYSDMKMGTQRFP